MSSGDEFSQSSKLSNVQLYTPSFKTTSTYSHNSVNSSITFSLDSDDSYLSNEIILLDKKRPLKEIVNQKIENDIDTDDNTIIYNT